MTFPTLRQTAIRQLVQAITDGPSGYRKARELVELFAGLGGDFERLRDESRIRYTARVIEDTQRRGQFELLLGTVLEAEAAEETRATLRQVFNEILAPYGWTLTQDTGSAITGSAITLRPLVIPWKPLTPDILGVPDFQHAFLTDDERTLLRERWVEAVALQQAGLSRPMFLGLGAILEHVLMACAQSYPDRAHAAPRHLGNVREWRLDVLLAVARDQGWITPTVLDFPYRIRHYRDYITPAHELREGDFLDDALISDTWRTVRRTLDELHDRTRTLPLQARETQKPRSAGFI
ncbi:hypothetical protein [Deinococcus sp. UR1]|uniref:hypothetical protein n=1 Tax=Deinococcus sp. UR1 TaxID=1704277 RepID=UPI0006DC6746|nr:hypothetical protein [Deinococcus sp. UR1]PIG99476.1 hypothetical protein AMD26_004160 [Deinococcus sp. UR1]